jgi:hypothetical protein
VAAVTKKPPPLDLVEPTTRNSARIAAIASRKRSEYLYADFSDSDDSEYKAAASEDSESEEVFAEPAKCKPHPEGRGMKLVAKGPPAKKYKTPTDKVCSSSLVISLLAYEFISSGYEFTCNFEFTDASSQGCLSCDQLQSQAWTIH